MTLAEKLRFLANRAEDCKPFRIGRTKYVFNAQSNDLEYVSAKNSLETSDLKHYEFSDPLQWEFTEEEKTIMRNIDDKWKWIARDESGSLFVYNTEPYKLENYWNVSSNIYAIFNCFKHLFPSVQWSDEEPCEFRRYI